MRWSHAWLLVVLLLAPPARSAEPQGRIVEDIWNAAYLDGAQGGYVHTSVREVERDGQKLYHAVSELNLTLKRNGATIQLRVETGSEETTQGKVRSVWMRQYLGNGEQLVLKGTVHEGQIAVQVEGKAHLAKTIPWNEQVLGLYRQEQLFRNHKVRPGDQFSYLSFEPILTWIVTNRVNVKDFEEIEVFKVPKRLLRVETVPDKVVLPGVNVALPKLINWLDKDLQPVRSEVEMAQLGTWILYRCSKEQALGPRRATTDLVQASLIPLKRPISRPNETRSAVYRISVKGDEDPTTTFAQDSRQECKNVHGYTFELHVHAKQPPPAAIGPVQVKDEFIKSCDWIDSDDARIRKYARLAVGKRTDPWEQAKAIETWVHQNMHLSSSEPFAPASEVAKTLKGDCRQYGLLTTAMCRAAGIPARTALGLCYAYDRTQGPVMAFHLWTEVFVRGEWVAMDATRGEGYVGATHLKITDSSWHDIQSLTPLLPVFRVLGKLSIEVVRVDGPN